MTTKNSESPSTLPLNGIRVVDLSRVLAGPVCGAMLGDMGAEIIKIEDVNHGDESRHWAPQKEGHSPVFIANNRNKKSVSIDLKTPEGVRLLKSLIQEADVLIENFGTGTMERLDLDYPTLAAINDRLIYCSISAFGRQGPRANEAGYEALMQAFTGIMSITGEPDGVPVRCGVSALDIYTGTLSAFAIVNAILLRQQCGKGQRLDASLFDSALGLLNFQAQNYLLCGVEPKPMGSAHPSLVPYQSFRCGDHRWVFIAAGNDRLWQRLTNVLGRPDLASDDRFKRNIDRVGNRAILENIIHDCLLPLSAEEVVNRCKNEGVPVSLVNSLTDTLQDPQMAFAATLRPTLHPELGPIDVVSLPVRFSAMNELPNRPAPGHGQNTKEVLRELGIKDREIDALSRQGVIFCGHNNIP